MRLRARANTVRAQPPNTGPRSNARSGNFRHKFLRTSEKVSGALCDAQYVAPAGLNVTNELYPSTHMANMVYK